MAKHYTVSIYLAGTTDSIERATVDQVVAEAVSALDALPLQRGASLNVNVTVSEAPADA